MKTSIRINLLKKVAILSAIISLLTPIALADSVYDGIWQMGYVGRDGVWQPRNNYFSITMKDKTVFVADLSAIAYSKNTMKGAFFGSLPDNIRLIPLPSSNNPLSIRVTVDPEVTKAVGLEYEAAVRENPFSLATSGVFFYSWQIDFTSKDAAIIQHPMKDYPFVELLPPARLRKIF